MVDHQSVIQRQPRRQQQRGNNLEQQQQRGRARHLCVPRQRLAGEHPGEPRTAPTMHYGPPTLYRSIDQRPRRDMLLQDAVNVPCTEQLRIEQVRTSPILWTEIFTLHSVLLAQLALFQDQLLVILYRALLSCSL